MILYFKKILSYLLEIGKDFLSKFFLFKWLMKTSFFVFIQNHKCFALALPGALLENMLISVSAGSYAENFGELVSAIALSSICSFLCDMSILLVLIFVIKKNLSFLEKYPKITNLCKRFGIYSMLIYRFVFFARIPALLIASVGSFRKIMILNLIGALLSQTIFMSFGYIMTVFYH